LRRFSIANPFSSGYVSEVPDYVVPVEKASFAQDSFAPNGVVRQRRGLSYATSVLSPTTINIYSTAKTKFARNGNTRVVGVTQANDFYVCSTPDQGTLNSFMTTPGITGSYLPRCVYEGELIFCHTSGQVPLLRYAGAVPRGFSAGSSAATISMPAGSFQVSTTSIGGVGTRTGEYLHFTAPDGAGNFQYQPPLCDLIVQDTSTANVYITEVMRNTNGGSTATTNSTVSQATLGTTWPAVPVHEGFVSSISGLTVTPAGIAPATDVFTGGGSYNSTKDAIAIGGPSTTFPHIIAGVTVTTSTTLDTHYAIIPGYAGNKYFILRRCPFRDAEVHKESLWGVGVKEFPSTVYVWPQTSNIGIPPMSVAPYAATSRAGYSNSTVTGFLTENDYTLFSLDVPSKYDTTPIEAILSTDGPLLVLKTDSVYGIYGAFDSTSRDTGGGLEVNKIADWGGCLDLRSAISGENGVYWAGGDGIYTWRGGQVVDLTAGVVQREWRALMLGYQRGTSTVSCGIAANRYLVVAAAGLDNTKTSGAMIGPDTSAPSSRTLVYDIATSSWLGRMTNFSPTHMWTSAEEDGGAACLAASNNDSRIIDCGVAYEPESALATDATNASFPSMKLWSTASLAQAEGIEGEARFCDAVIHSNLYDVSTPTTSITATVASGGSLYTDPTSSKTIGSISATTTDRVDRDKFSVNRSGRLHQIRLEVSATDSSNAKSEISEIVMSFRDSRRGT
jgi:hypothetical protein